jgi:hypothetical protein
MYTKKHQYPKKNSTYTYIDDITKNMLVELVEKSLTKTPKRTCEYCHSVLQEETEKKKTQSEILTEAIHHLYAKILMRDDSEILTRNESEQKQENQIQNKPIEEPEIPMLKKPWTL